MRSLSTTLRNSINVSNVHYNLCSVLFSHALLACRNLINILAEISQTGKQRHIPYRDSRLTFLLQDSLGGNAKMAMICAISPAER